MKMIVIYIIAGVLILLVLVFILLRPDKNTSTSQPSDLPSNSLLPLDASPEASPSAESIVFGSSKKAAHYVSNEPAHAETVNTVPAEVKIKFNFDLAAPSSISIMHDGVEYGSGDTRISSDRLTLSRAVKSDAPEGLYNVTYKACWPDKSCHDGNFQFAIKK